MYVELWITCLDVNESSSLILLNTNLVDYYDYEMEQRINEWQKTGTPYTDE